MSQPEGAPLGLTSFVGREREVTEVGRLLASHPLITLTGPGGAGKTRLASAAALEAVKDFEDGAWWVDLAPLSHPDLVPQAVAQALNVPETPTHSLTDAIAWDLRELEILIVLDNCEHLVGACARLADDLLHACPGLVVLATSREALGIGGERNFPVPPLSVPEPDHAQALESLQHYEAVRLFVERAKVAAPGFEVTEANAAAVARLCRRLDGMPLAIELAAARTRVLSVEQLASRLDESFDLLTGSNRTTMPRQRTLRAAIDWSYELLGDRERIVFRRLSVFAGGFTLEAAEAVSTGGDIERDEILDLLTRLVDKSLLLAMDWDGEARYRLLETVGQYGQERLQESGEAEPVKERHAEYFLALAEEAEPELRGARQDEWLQRLDEERGNLRVALGWAVEGDDAELGLRLAGALERFWWARGYLGEGRGWLERGLAARGPLSVSTRAKALNEAGWMALWQDDLVRAVELLEEGLASYKDLRDEPHIATSLTNLGHAALHQDDKARLKALCEDAETLRTRFTDRWAIAELLVFLGMAALYEGDHEGATVLLEEGMATFRDIGDTQRVPICVTYLWMAALEGGDTGRAAALLEEDLRRLRSLEFKLQIQVYDDLMGSAVLAALGRRPARATRLWGAAEDLREAIGLSIALWDHTPTDLGAQLSALRSHLDGAAFDAMWLEGRAMTPVEAIEYALRTEEAAPTAPSSLLSGRETEVLVLVAEGLTNPQVAGRLYLSPRTVGQHLRSVYRKLGVPSRAAAVKEASERGLI